MSSRQTDVSLVIKARDEATQAISAIDGALQDLLGTQANLARGSRDTATGLTKIVSTLAGLDKAYASIATATDRAGDATARQLSTLARNQAALASLEKQLDSARAAQQRFNDFVGPRTQTDSGRFAAVSAEIKNLEKQFRDLSREIGKQEAGFTRSTSDLNDLGRAQRLAAAVTTFATQQANEHTQALEREAAAAREVRQELGRRADAPRQAQAAQSFFTARAMSPLSGGSAEDSADVFRRAGLTSFEQAEQQLAIAAARLREQLAPLTTIQGRLNAELARLPAIAKAGKFSVQEMAAAEALLRKNADDATKAIARQNAGSGKFAALGLRPHELQNLGFQINDVVTQLASGASLTQTLAQQGGQIVQIFPRAGSAIAGALSNPVALAFAATLGSIVLGMKEAGDEASRLRGFLGLLSATGNQADYGAAALNDASEALDRYGLSAEEALSTVRTFVREGIVQDRIEEFGEAASDLAEVMGVDLKQATDEVANAFTGSYSEIRKLDDAYNFLTAAQLEHIRTLVEEGKAADARSYAFQVFRTNMQDIAEKSRGPWAGAARELSAAWQEFTEFLGETDKIRSYAGSLEILGAAARDAIRWLRGVDSGTSGNAAEVAKQIRDKVDELGRVARQPGSRARAAEMARIRQEISDLSNEYERLIRVQAAQAVQDTRATQPQRVQKQTKELERQTQSLREQGTVAGAIKQAREEALRYVESSATFADQAAKDEYINLKVTEAREAALKRVAQERKREADEAQRARREAERLAKQTQFIMPVDGRVTSGVGVRRAPNAGASTFHKGLDIAVPVGTPVKAPAGGTVIEVGTDSKLGKFVFIDHGNNVVSKFGHLSDTSQVSAGDIVTQGQQIARSGNTGNSTGPHLHYQVEVGGKPVDPRKGMFPDDGPGRFAIDLADAAADADKAAEKLLQRQAEYLGALDETLDIRQRDTAQLQQQIGLQGDALLAAQREAAIEDAIAKARADAAKAGVSPDDPGLAKRIEDLRAVEGAYFDATHARERFDNARAAADRPVEELTTLRDQLQQQIQFYQDRGQIGMADQLEPQLDAVNAKLREAIDNAIRFYQALTPGTTAFPGTREELDAIIQRLEFGKIQSQELKSILGITGQTIAQTFTNAATNALDGFAQAIANGENAFKSLGQAFLQFAADFLRQIAQMIQQQVIFNIVSGILGGLGGGGLKADAAATIAANPSIFHAGGVAGWSAPTRAVDPGWFQNALRFHTGGIAGLRPNEVPAILERGEEVLTESDPRHRRNGGAAGGVDPGSIKIVNSFEPADLLTKALGTKAGERAILNFVRENSGAFEVSLGRK